jgi:hypothetical protein
MECGAALHGRVDKKFCSDQCRSGYYNHLNTANRAYMRRINYILKKNYRILNDLHQGGKTQVGIDTLKTKGFDFNHFTSLYPSPEGVNYFCYEKGFVREENKDSIRLLIKEI